MCDFPYFCASISKNCGECKMQFMSSGVTKNEDPNDSNEDSKCTASLGPDRTCSVAEHHLSCHWSSQISRWTKSFTRLLDTIELLREILLTPMYRLVLRYSIHNRRMYIRKLKPVFRTHDSKTRTSCPPITPSTSLQLWPKLASDAAEPQKNEA